MLRPPAAPAPEPPATAPTRPVPLRPVACGPDPPALRLPVTGPKRDEPVALDPMPPGPDEDSEGPLVERTNAAPVVTIASNPKAIHLAFMTSGAPGLKADQARGASSATIAPDVPCTHYRFANPPDQPPPLRKPRFPIDEHSSPTATIRTRQHPGSLGQTGTIGPDEPRAWAGRGCSRARVRYSRIRHSDVVPLVTAISD